MPHKRNPVLSENLTGLARYIRSAVIPSMENIVLWHERDISHSSVERIMAPDISIALDFSLNRLNEIVTTMKVYPKNMEKNLNLLTPILENKSQTLMKAIDVTNAKYGRNVISVAQAGINNSWKMRREHSSKIDTASFDSLPKISI